MNLQRRGKFSIAALRRLVTRLRERDVGTLVAMNLYSSLYAVLAAALHKQNLRVALSVNTTGFTSRKEALQI